MQNKNEYLILFQIYYKYPWLLSKRTIWKISMTLKYIVKFHLYMLQKILVRRQYDFDNRIVIFFNIMVEMFPISNNDNNYIVYICRIEVRIKEMGV